MSVTGSVRREEVSVIGTVRVSVTGSVRSGEVSVTGTVRCQ